MSDYPTTNWFHKLDGTLGLVVHRTTLHQDEPELVRDLSNIITEARRFAETVGDRYVGGFPITLETMVAFAKAHERLDDLRTMVEAELSKRPGA